MNLPTLNGVRLLLVEDEAMIAMFLENLLQSNGYEVVGPMARIEAALDAAEYEPMLDAALLDVNLGRCMVYPVADALALRNIPIVFMTGYGANGVPGRFCHSPIVTKPYTETMVLNALARVLKLPNALTPLAL
jgi:CheY-like chemotaxis protein